MKRVFVFLFLAFVIVSACSNPSYERLESIYSHLINDSEWTDSALIAFNGVDSTSLHTRKQKALYSLVKVMVLDRNYIDVTDISYIEPAIEWYAKHQIKNDYYAASLFYKGRIHMNLGAFSESIVDLIQSRDKSKSLQRKSLSTMLIGRIYGDNYLNEEELKYSQEALSLCEEWGDSLNIQKARLNLATAYHNNACDYQADSLLSLIIGSSAPIPDAYANRAEYYVKGYKEDYEEIANLFESAINYGYQLLDGHRIEHAYALYKSGYKNRAYNILDSLSLQGGSLELYHWYGKIAEEERNYKLALECAHMVDKYTDSIATNQLEQSVFRTLMNQYRVNAEISLKQKRNVVCYSVSLSVLLLCLMASLYYVFQGRREHLENEIERLFGIAEESRKMLLEAENKSREAEYESDKNKKSLSTLRRTYAKLYQRQFAEIGHLFDYCRDDTNISREAANRYLKRTAEIIGEINHGTERQGEFESRINLELDNIMLKLRQDFPEFKETDFLFLSYVIVGFDATTRAIILNETPNNMRVKKARLVKKILNSQSSNKLLYSCFFHSDK